MSVGQLTKLISVSRCGIAAGIISLSILSSGDVLAAQHIFATEVQEVRSSSVDGNHVLTLEIKDVTGPLGCKGSTVTLQRSSHSPQPIEADLEAIALRALLSSEAIVLSVPTDFEHCVDGKPTFSDLWLLSYE